MTHACAVVAYTFIFDVTSDQMTHVGKGKLLAINSLAFRDFRGVKMTDVIVHYDVSRKVPNAAITL